MATTERRQDKAFARKLVSQAEEEPHSLEIAPAVHHKGYDCDIDVVRHSPDPADEETKESSVLVSYPAQRFSADRLHVVHVHETKCFICELVLRSPHITSCCSRNFCKECIQRVQKDGKCCPWCKSKGFVLIYNRAHDQTLKELEVYCTHRKSGCKWKGKLEMLDKHLNEDPTIDNQREGCGYVEVQCYNGCEQSFLRHLIAKHQSECTERPYSCEYCTEWTQSYSEFVKKHWPVCEHYPVPCPNKCLQSPVPRQDLKQHLKEKCPFQEVECEFKYAGCETKLPRKDMPGHLQENVVHMSMLARRNLELKDELLKHRREIKTITEENRGEVAKAMQEVQSQEQQLQGLQREIENSNNKISVNRRNSVSRAEHDELSQKVVTRKKLEGKMQHLEQKQTEAIDTLRDEHQRDQTALERMKRDWEKDSKRLGPQMTLKLAAWVVGLLMLAIIISTKL